MTTYSFPPPPPPPPPPPLPGTPAWSAARAAAGKTTGSFASARSTLKHTDPPVENPINPAYSGLSSTKRKGQPTLNMGADKMADFLKELKAKRLRKISNAPDGSFVVPEPPPDSSLDTSSDYASASRSVSLEERSILSQLPMRPPRPNTNAAPYTSAKRKRALEGEDQPNTSTCEFFSCIGAAFVRNLSSFKHSSDGSSLLRIRQFDPMHQQVRPRLHFTPHSLESLEFQCPPCVHER